MQEVLENIKAEKYEAYKDSGKDWIGIIPANWKLVRFKNILSEINERSSDGNEDLLSVSQYTGITKKSEKIEEGDRSTNAESLEGYKLVKKGDLVSNIMLAWNGSLGFSQYDGIASPAYSVYRLKTKGSSQYFHYLLRSDLYKAEFKRNSTGVIESRLRLYTDDFFRLFSLFPTLTEQTRIATFLDKKTDQIDQAIAQKERLIELLKERRKIMIHKAVTQGLDPDVKMKDSGVEWIGKIPEHWEVIRIKHLSKKITDGEHISPEFTNHGMPFLSAKDIRDGFISFPENKFVSLRDGEKFRMRCEPERGDLLLVSRGATIGRVSMVDTDRKFCLLGSVILIKTNHRIFNGYLSATMSNKLVQEEFLNTSHHSAQQAIYLVKVSEVYIPVPGIAEQKQIATYTISINERINDAIRSQTEQIEKLKEYKASLIDSAVTGKIKI